MAIDPFTAISLGTKAVSFFKRGSARRKLRRANRLDAVNVLQRNLQRRRAFIRNARAAQAQAAVAATSFEGGLDSSAFQGTSASIRTQEGFGLHEFDEARRRNRRAAALRGSATRDLEVGQDIQQAGELINSGRDLFI